MLRLLRLLAALSFCVLCSCNKVTSHQVLSAVFDGVPTMPPAEQICSDYTAELLAKEREAKAGKAKAAASSPAGSAHRPYQEKRCDDCHDKTAESGFVVKRKEDLCFHCHSDFIKGSFVHGPVAVGDCLACHDPHTSTLPSLLKVAAANICAVCHHEARQAVSMHDATVSHGMICVNCHSPHYGNVRFFLK